MTRNDSILYSGASSASFGTNKQRQNITEEKKDKRGKLKPAAEVINETIVSEKRLLTEQLLRLPIDMKTTDEGVKSVLLSIQMNIAFIDRFHNKINNLLREKK